MASGISAVASILDAQYGWRSVGFAACGFCPPLSLFASVGYRGFSHKRCAFACPVAVPEKIGVRITHLIFSTAATRSPPSPCPRQRSARSPNELRSSDRKRSLRVQSLPPQPTQKGTLLGAFELVAGVGFEPHDLRVMSPTSYQAALPRDIWCRKPGSNRYEM